MKRRKVQTYDDFLALRQEYKCEAQKRMNCILRRVKMAPSETGRKSQGRYQQIAVYIEQVIAIYKGVTFGLRLIHKVRSMSRSLRNR